MKQMHFTVHGKVQGVWFRAWTQDLAKELGLTGWVRNTSDGNVEGLALGEDTQLAKFKERLHDGPPLARVTQVDSAESEAEDIIDSFNVRP
ncbi:acylphosphatase [Pseudodesulfovibrio sp. zrk46]|uniref:acylphosphatase n=1 Tax=Pseudodesulfovibrio sp. zrk46 TaxID=2725288 RepID=UPI0014494DE8|nr:acylphosphatase [Pseudodesulfovibrio sp. zrk46]QJB55441.1 acylphosphatase [Pseudodesulfovibrio sp. zrk46]